MQAVVGLEQDAAGTRGAPNAKTTRVYGKVECVGGVRKGCKSGNETCAFVMTIAWQNAKINRAFQK